jgi:hypothetical protein
MDDPPLLPRDDERPLSTWLWNAACLAAIVLAVLFLGGCAQVLSPVAAGANSASADAFRPAGSEDSEGSAYLPSLSPRVFGRCWVATAEEVGAWRTWRGDDYVPCTEQHTTYTYAAEDLPGELLQAMRSSLSDAADTALQAQIDDAVQSICSLHFTDLFPRLTERQVLVNWFSFLPTKAEVEAGAQWVRCDVGVYAIDPTSGAMELTALPENIHDLVDASYTSPGDYQYCRWAPASSSDDGPLRTEGSQPAACDDAARWVFDGVQSLNYPAEAPYPGRDAIVQAARDACDAAARLRGEEQASTGWAYFPSEQTWAEGSRTADCWSKLA